MANHKKHPNRNRRGHCHMCKPWKDFHAGKQDRNFSKKLTRKEFVSIEI